MTLGEVLKLLRTEHNLTQPELADKARIEQSYLSKLENDKATPSFDIINRLAQALGLTGMALIHKLSQSYINENLSHLPEVAAEYASVKEKRERSSKRQLLLAAGFLLLGTALYLTGIKQLVASDTEWFYVSEGVIKPGEHYERFSDSYIREINESKEEVERRLQENRTRIDRSYQKSQRFQGWDYLVDVPGGQRYYKVRQNQPPEHHAINKLLEILGVLFGLAGVLLAAYSLWKYRRA